MPTRIAINRITTESTNIYQYVYSLRENTLVFVDPIDIDGEVPEEEYIDWDSKWLWSNKYRRTSNMQAEYLKLWLVEAQDEEFPDDTLWSNVAKLIYAEFLDEKI